MINTDKKTYKQKVIYKLKLNEFIDTNWNKQTYWKDQGEGHKKRLGASETPIWMVLTLIAIIYTF